MTPSNNQTNEIINSNFSSVGSKKAKQTTNWSSYDDITCMTIELGFHQYFNTNFDEEYRYVEINPSYRVDLKEWVEVDNDDCSKKRRVRRAGFKISKQRPATSVRFTDPEPFLLLS